MHDRDDPTGWFSRWPHDRISFVDACSAVHTRFGFAAQAASELETALVMLVSQVQQVRESCLTFDDLLEYLARNGAKCLGQLAARLVLSCPLPEDLPEALDVAVKRRNYLIHHFYRHRAELFHTPEGCEQLKDELVSIQDDLSVAVELLRAWLDGSPGAIADDDIRDEIRRDVQKWRRENDAMLKAMLGKKNAI